MNIKLIKSLLLSLTLFVLSSFFVVAQASPRLYFDPTSKTVTKDAEFQINLNIDVESNQAFGTDAVLKYNASDLTLTSLTNGGFFSDFSYANDQANGKIELHAFFSSPFQSKSGSGTVGYIKFVPKKDSGSSSLTFSCGESGATTQILNNNGSNILTCSSLGGSDFTYAAANSGGGGGGGNNNTPTPTAPPTVKPTVKPTIKPTIKPLSSPLASSSPTPITSATPIVVALTSPIPLASTTPLPSETPLGQEKESFLAGILPILLIGVIVLVFAVVGFFLLKWIFAKPPETIPPASIPPYPTIPNHEPYTPEVGQGTNQYPTGQASEVPVSNPAQSQMYESPSVQGFSEKPLTPSVPVTEPQSPDYTTQIGQTPPQNENLNQYPDQNLPNQNYPQPGSNQDNNPT